MGCCPEASSRTTGRSIGAARIAAEFIFRADSRRSVGFLHPRVAGRAMTPPGLLWAWRGTRFLRRPDRRHARPSTGPARARRDAAQGSGGRRGRHSTAAGDRAAPAVSPRAEDRAATAHPPGAGDPLWPACFGRPRATARFGSVRDGAGGERGKNCPLPVPDPAAMEDTAMGSVRGLQPRPAGAPGKDHRGPSRYPKQRLRY